MTPAGRDTVRATNPASPSVLSGEPHLGQTLVQRVLQRTGGRIQLLRVEVIGERVVVRGFVSSYHVKQLALQGVLDVLGPAGGRRIELEIEVVGRPTKFRSGAL